MHRDELEAGKYKQTVLVRLLHIWEAKNFKLNGALMSLDLLLLDEKGETFLIGLNLTCGACSKKLERSGTSLICIKCDSTTIVGVAKFRVELIVQSEEKTATIVMFDRDARKIAHSTAEDLSQSEAQEDGSSSGPSVLKCLLSMIGKTMSFQVKISKYNFETSTQNFIVTRIVAENPSQETTTPETAEVGKSIRIEDGGGHPTFINADIPTGLNNKEDAANDQEDNVENDAKKRQVE